jgi:formamidopyrimidine-DNA glycosylase
MMHFGMTGEPVYYKKAEQEPDYARLIINFSNGYHLAFNCMRMLGEVAIVESVNQFIKEKELGPDVFAEDFDFNTFSELLQNKRGMIKSALMDQSLMAGIGNECSDEILFQSRIHPKTKVADLKEDQRRKIYDAMKGVLDKKIDSNIKNEALPDSFILSHRSESADCPACNGTIEKISVGGRNGYYCPQCQQM